MAETDLWFGTLSATVRVEDLPASRQVVAIERQANGDWRVCGQAVSSAEGIATLPITGLPTSRIYAIAIDEWGKPFAPGMPVAYGDVIRPTQFLGWMYQVTSPGVLPGTEPEWWNSMAGVPQPVGTAMMQAVRHYQPIAHGPVSDIEWVEQEFDPYWDKVVSLLRFDEDFVDEAGRVWTAGTSTSIDSSAPIFGSSSLKISGFGEGLYTGNPIADPAAHFTIEGFFRVDGMPPTNSAGLTRTALWSQNQSGGNGEFGLLLDHSDSVPVLMLDLRGGTSGLDFLANLPDFKMGEVIHIAHCYDGAYHRVFMDGITIISTAQPFGWKNTNQPFRVGQSINPSYMQYRNGGDTTFDEFRITKGIARYTENFDPPTGPFPNVGPPL